MSRPSQKKDHRGPHLFPCNNTTSVGRSKRTSKKHGRTSVLGHLGRKEMPSWLSPTPPQRLGRLINVRGDVAAETTTTKKRAHRQGLGDCCWGENTQKKKDNFCSVGPPFGPHLSIVSGPPLASSRVAVRRIVRSLAGRPGGQAFSPGHHDSVEGERTYLAK